MAVNSVSPSVSQGLSAVVQDIQKERLAQSRQQQSSDVSSKRDGLKIEAIEKSDSRIDAVQQQVQASEARRTEKSLEVKSIQEDASESRGLNIAQAFSREAPIGGGRNQRPGSLLDITV